MWSIISETCGKPQNRAFLAGQALTDYFSGILGHKKSQGTKKVVPWHKAEF
jgi:hypothetical protein